MKVRPLHDRVLIKTSRRAGNDSRRDHHSRTRRRKSPRKAKSSPSAPASGWKTEKCMPLEVKEGDRVLFGKYSGTEIKVDDNDYLILREDEILGNFGNTPAKLPERNRRTNGKANCSWRRIPAGDPARRESACRRSQDYAWTEGTQRRSR